LLATPHNSILPSSCVFKAGKYISVCWHRSNVLWAPANTFFFDFPITPIMLYC
jgi:hypothetical protein